MEIVIVSRILNGAPLLQSISSISGSNSNIRNKTRNVKTTLQEQITNLNHHNYNHHYHHLVSLRSCQIMEIPIGYSQVTTQSRRRILEASNWTIAPVSGMLIQIVQHEYP